MKTNNATLLNEFSSVLQRKLKSEDLSLEEAKEWLQIADRVQLYSLTTFMMQQVDLTDLNAKLDLFQTIVSYLPQLKEKLAAESIEDQQLNALVAKAAAISIDADAIAALKDAVSSGTPTETPVEPPVVVEPPVSETPVVTPQP
ncbi:MAG TPA: hypothetical protein V6D33_08995 [Cyanophyceae cyanobacterium]